MDRNRVDAAFAMAAKIERKKLPAQLKQAMQRLSDGGDRFLQAWERMTGLAR
jgi:hypothetical protein